MTVGPGLAAGERRLEVRCRGGGVAVSSPATRATRPSRTMRIERMRGQPPSRIRVEYRGYGGQQSGLNGPKSAGSSAAPIDPTAPETRADRFGEVRPACAGAVAPDGNSGAAELDGDDMELPQQKTLHLLRQRSQGLSRTLRGFPSIPLGTSYVTDRRCQECRPRTTGRSARWRHCCMRRRARCWWRCPGNSRSR